MFDLISRRVRQPPEDSNASTSDHPDRDTGDRQSDQRMQYAAHDHVDTTLIRPRLHGVTKSLRNLLSRTLDRGSSPFDVAVDVSRQYGNKRRGVHEHGISTLDRVDSNFVRARLLQRLAQAAVGGVHSLGRREDSSHRAEGDDFAILK